MKVVNPLARGWLLVLCLALSGTKCSDDVSISTEVDDAQKISDTAGNLDVDLDDGDRFGSAIAAIGDLEGDGVLDLGVGAPGDDDGGDNRGAVWILFMDDDGRVDLRRKISEDNVAFPDRLDNNDRFGSAVAAVGDLNLDGVFDIAVGAPGDDDGGDNRGAVWILFLDPEGTVQDLQKISARVGGDLLGRLDDNDRFGSAVTSLGDLNGDGIPELAVGAPDDSDGGTGKGAVWILFMNNDGSVQSVQKISDEEGDLEVDLDTNDHFGSALAGIGDLDGDGTNDLAVGASGDDDGGFDRGAVWILFLNNDGTVNDAQKTSQNDGEFDGTLGDGDGFGSALANIGDLDQDGIADLAAGAPLSDDGGTDRGAVWILFPGETGELRSELKISDTEGNFDTNLSDGDRFGAAVAGIGDLNDDGRVDIGVGAPGDDDGGTDRGAVWILFLERVEIESDFELFP
ncbi:MAG: integrin alpha [Gammaproteobacteria bacterium]